MPSSLRGNPTTGLAEYFHPDSGLYVAAAALMQTVGGLEVALSTAQANSLNTIANSVSGFSEITSELRDVESKIELFRQSIATINGNGFRDLIQAVNDSSSTSTQATLTSIDTKLTALQQTVSSFSARFDLIRDYSSPIAAIATKSDEIKIAIAALTGILTPPSVMVCQTIDLVSTTAQYTLSIPAGTKKIAFGCRNDRTLNDVTADIRYSMVSDQVFPIATNNNYGVLSAGFTEEFEVTVTTARSIYFASSVANTKLLFRRWS